MNEQQQDPSLRPCPECGGQRTFTKYTKQYPNVEIKLKRPGLFMNTSPIDALTCLTCGYTTFYATHPENLRPYNYKM